MYLYSNSNSGARLGDSASAVNARLKEMAKWPEKAHLAWKRLSTDDRRFVVMQMVANYGGEFAKSFLRLAGTKTDKDLVNKYFGRETGPTPPRLEAQGFRLAQQDSVNQWWVHPSGVNVVRNKSDDAGVRPPAPLTPATPARSTKCRLADLTAENRCRFADQVCELMRSTNEYRLGPQCEEQRSGCKRVRQSAQTCTN